MNPANQLLEHIKAGLEQLGFAPNGDLSHRTDLQVIVDQSEVFRQACEFNPRERLVVGR